MRKKLLILILVFSAGFTAPMYLVSGAGAIAYISKEFGLDTIARALGRKALSRLSNGVIEKINTLGVTKSGKPGDPSFVQNWKGFLADAQTIGENQFRAQLSYVVDKGILCKDLQDPLVKGFNSKNIKGLNIGDPKFAELKQDTTLYQTKVKCTIPEKTRKDFSKNFEKGGGWKTWSRLMEPQNNLAGALSLSLEELHKQRSSQQEARKSEAVSGSGFKGVQDACKNIDVTASSCYQRCIGYTPKDKYTPAFCETECAGDTGGAESKCVFLGKTVTPAKLLGEGAANWLDSEGKWLASSDELSEVLINILTASLNKLTSFATKDFIKNVDNLTKDSCTGTYCGGDTSDAEKDRIDFQTIKTNTGKSSCTDIDGSGGIDERDCGDPSNNNCSLCN